MTSDLAEKMAVVEALWPTRQPSPPLTPAQLTLWHRTAADVDLTVWTMAMTWLSKMRPDDRCRFRPELPEVHAAVEGAKAEVRRRASAETPVQPSRPASPETARAGLRVCRQQLADVSKLNDPTYNAICPAALESCRSALNQGVPTVTINVPASACEVLACEGGTE